MKRTSTGLAALLFVAAALSAAFAGTRPAAAAAVPPVVTAMSDRPGPTPDHLAAILAGPNVTVGHAHYVGSTDAGGSFFNGTDGLGMASGVVLSTGRVADVPGSNNGASVGTDNGQPGDALLNTLSDTGCAGTVTDGPDCPSDAAVLSFDAVPAFDNLSLVFGFASNEYPNGPDGQPDAVGIFVADGSDSAPTNCATVPGAGTPVNSRTVSSTTNSWLYVNNPPTDGGTSALPIRLNGRTTPITCQLNNLVPGQTLHVTLGIEDVSDTSYNQQIDSVAFFAAGSLTSVDTRTPTALHLNATPTVQYLNPVTVDGLLTSALPSLPGLTSGTPAPYPTFGSPSPIGGAPVTFAWSDASGAPDPVTATTDSTGNARTSLSADRPAGTYHVSATFPGTALVQPAASTPQQVVVVPRTCALTLTASPATPVAGGTEQLTATMAENQNTVGDLTNRPVTFTVSNGSDVVQRAAKTSRAGVATTTVPVEAGNLTFSAAHPGDSYYAPCAATPFTVAAAPDPVTPSPTPSPTDTQTETPPTTSPSPTPATASPTPTPTPTTSTPTTSPTTTSPGTAVVTSSPPSSPPTQQPQHTSAPLTPGPVLPSTSPSVSPPVPVAHPAARPVARSRADVGQRWVASVPDLRHVAWDVRTVTLNALVAGLLLLMIMFPAELFNGTLKENYEEVKGWFGPVGRIGDMAGRLRNWLGVPPIVPAAAFALVIGASYTLLLPDAHADAASLRLILALAIGLGLTTILANYAAIAYTRLRFRTAGTVSVRWGALPFALACVVLSRFVHFEPGYLYGLVAGFEFHRELKRSQRGQAVLAWSLIGLAVVALGWLAIEPMKHWVEESHRAFWPLVLEETTVAVTVEGLTALSLALLPMTFLEGSALYTWSRKAWVAVYGVVAFCFLQLVVHPEFAGRESSVPTIVWVALFLGFGLLSLCFWAYFRFRPPHEHGEVSEATT